jgi:hypothetical protein
MAAGSAIRGDYPPVGRFPTTKEAPVNRDELPEYVQAALALIDAFSQFWPDAEVAIPGEETSGRMLARLDYGKLQARVLGKFLLHLDATLENPESNRKDVISAFLDEVEVDRLMANAILDDLLGRIGED